MSRIVYTWELGAGYGHIARFHAVAQQLKSRGHEIIFVLKNLEHANGLLGNNQFRYLQGPVRWASPQKSSTAISYAGILKSAGFDDSEGLYARVSAWRSLYELIKPNLILFDHAPTALLGAGGLDIPKALFGAGFFSPPRITPMPPLRPWLKTPEKELTSIENQILRVINLVRKQLDWQPLEMLSDLFDVNEDFLCTFAELDHYPQRSNAHYWGPSLYQSSGIEPKWPLVGDRKIFAYLNRDYTGLENLLQQLRATPHAVLAHIAGITPAFIQKYSGANLHISPHAYKLKEICTQADLCICHGGTATLSSFLLSGKPILSVPMQLEQSLSAYNLEKLGAGKHVNPELKKPNFKNLILELIDTPRYREAATAFANRHADFNPDRQAHQIADRCETLIAGHSRH